MTSQDREFYKAIETVVGIIGVTLGAIPLAMWLIFQDESTLINVIFRHPERPWTWLIPAAIAVISFIALVIVDEHIKRGEQESAEKNP